MSSGFSYPQPIFQSPIYNPAFYLTLDASGYLTYDYAQTLYLDKNDYRLTYITGITPGTATQGIALVPGTNNDVSGIGALSCSSLTVGGSAVAAPPAYVVGVLPGTASINKALALGASGEIATITSLTATSITGTLQTSAQPNITSIGMLTNLTLSTSSTGLQTPNIKFGNVTTSLYDNFDHLAFIGFSYGGAVGQKALVVDVDKDIGSIRTLDAQNLNASTKVSGTLGDFGGLNINSTLVLTSSRNIVNVGTITTSGIIDSTGYRISGSDVIDSSRNVYAATVSSGIAMMSLPAGSTFTSPMHVDKFNLILNQSTNTTNCFTGMCFHIDTGAINTTPPSSCIIAERTTATAYDRSNISFWTKESAGQVINLSRQMTIMKNGSINFGDGTSTDGDLILMKAAASPLFRFGTALSAKNCITMQWNYVGAGLDTNRLSFDIYGTSNTLCLTTNDRVCVGGNVPESRFLVVSSGSNLYGSWERCCEYWNDNATPMKAGLILYNENGGSNLNGMSFGTYTSDPLNFMIGGTNRMTLKTSSRLNINRSEGPEATVHAGGMIWADEYFHSKQNVDGKSVYRTNWSQANYLAMGTDATVGAMRLGTCDASFNWVAYAPVRGGAYTNASDRRIKRDIIDIPYGLAQVLQLQPRKFAMRNDGSQHIGFIAQEISEIIPECVSSVESADDELNESGEPINPMCIDLASLVSVLCKAIQEQQQQISDQRAQIDVLRSQG